jgi:hypothetical protein
MVRGTRTMAKSKKSKLEITNFDFLLFNFEFEAYFFSAPAVPTLFNAAVQSMLMADFSILI